MKLLHIVPLALLVVACGSDITPPPRPDPEPVDLTAVVNIQLGDTPAGTQPMYIITGQVRAFQGGVRVNADVDSIVVFHQVGDNWQRVARHGGVPVDGRLPFNAAAGEPYRMLARLFAVGWSGSITAHTMVEREAAGAGY